MKKLRVIIGGFLALAPAGGLTWDYVQYLLGFDELGHDVYYIEDTRIFPIYQKAGSKWDDCSDSVLYLAKTMEYFGMSDRWAYRDEASGQCFGLSEAKMNKIIRTADILLNVSCATAPREEYLQIPKRILLDTDPMFTQIQIASEQKFTPGESNWEKMMHSHTHFFTYGENIGSEDCRIPTADFKWQATRQPISLKHWKYEPLPSAATASMTTVMNWNAAKNLEFENESWGQKDVEFLRFFDLPQNISNLSFAVAVGQTGGTKGGFPVDKAKKVGWNVLSPEVCADSVVSYKNFIENSIGEFSVAKETYIKAKTGWFSGRSACYLATGRPVITQETGWSNFIPTGNGLFAFSNKNEAIEAIRKLLGNVKKHSRNAREIAEEYFDCRKVLQRMLEQIS